MQAEAGASLISTHSTASRTGRTRRPVLPAVLILVGALVWALDQATKAWALRALTPGEPEPLIGTVLQLHLLFNPGAAFSLGTNITPVFAAIQAAVVVAILVIAWRVRSLWWALGLGLVLGGAAGNLTDRLTRPPGFAHGWVVDFLQLPNWPVFNVADSAICTAAVVLAIVTFRGIGLDGARIDPKAESGDDAAADRSEAARTPEGDVAGEVVVDETTVRHDIPGPADTDAQPRRG